MKNNQYYFNISKKHKEKPLDENYIFKDKHPDLKKYISQTKEIKEILITIKRLISDKESKSIIDSYFLKLQKVLMAFGNCSEFACFINACDNTLESVQKDLGTLKKITILYFEKRDLNEIVPIEWIQALLDSHASRKKGECGENKLINILKKYKFDYVDSWENFNAKNKCVAKFKKDFKLKETRKKLKIKLSTKKQGKNLDLIIKIDKKIFIVEAKHVNISGGAQDKQISELIEIISLNEKNKDIHYISFLDGNYSNIVLSDSIKKKNGSKKTKKLKEKLNNQQKEIKKYLLKNKNNFWLNTAGFKSLIKDLVIFSKN